MVIRLRHRWFVIGSMLALGTWIAVRNNGSGSGLVLPAIFLVGSLVAFRMRVVADNAGLKVVNLGWPKRIRWEEISGFSTQSYGWWATGYSLEIRLKDGRRVRGWALGETGGTGYPRSAAEKMLGELRRRLAEANGETTDEADARALDEALRSAESGDYAPFWDLVGDDRISPETLWGRVDALAARGRLDRDALERSGPKVSRSMRRRLLRKHPEIARELDEDGR